MPFIYTPKTSWRSTHQKNVIKIIKTKKSIQDLHTTKSGEDRHKPEMSSRSTHPKNMIKIYTFWKHHDHKYTTKMTFICTLLKHHEDLHNTQWHQYLHNPKNSSRAKHPKMSSRSTHPKNIIINTTKTSSHISKMSSAFAHSKVVN